MSPSVNVSQPVAPPPPPNPPMFGSQATKGAGDRQRQMAGASQGFGATILGGGNPTNTGNKTLLGQ
ncbi:MAG TPA: hypothetical protein VGA05_08405 [Candidatus Bathyarchaeia archaeon]